LRSYEISQRSLDGHVEGDRFGRDVLDELGERARRGRRGVGGYSSRGGYYSLMAHVLQRDALPRATGRGSPSEIPAVLLARLALSSRMQGHGLGAALLADAAERACLAARNVGAKFLVVDALHERAATFYEHHGFRRIPETMRLLQKMSVIAKALADA